MAVDSVEFAKTFRFGPFKAYLISFLRTGGAIATEVLSTGVAIASTGLPITSTFPTTIEPPSFREVIGVFAMTQGTGSQISILKKTAILVSATNPQLAAVEVVFNSSTSRVASILILGR